MSRPSVVERLGLASGTLSFFVLFFLPMAGGVPGVLVGILTAVGLLILARRLRRRRQREPAPILSRDLL